MAAAKKFTVTATRLYTLVDGKRTRFNRGDEVSGLSSEDVERYTRAGAIAAASEPAAKAAAASPAPPAHPAEGGPQDVPPPAPPHEASDLVAAANSEPALQKPAKAATKDVWVNYAVRSGQLTDDEAAGKTRDELRDTLK